MKTLQDLVDGLNDVFSTDDCFYLIYDADMKTIHLYRRLTDVYFELAEISKKYKSWLVGKDLYMQVGEVQKVIMNFLVKSNPDDWFAEKKYNIIIGKGSDGIKNIYKKSNEGRYLIDALADKADFNIEPYLFTENEIEELKSTLSEKLAKIVDLGKVEVKDETSN